MVRILRQFGRLISPVEASAEEINDLSAIAKSADAGLQALVSALNMAASNSRRVLLAGFELYEPELFKKIKKGMMSFDDLAACDNRSLQKILREVDSQELVKALKGAGPNLRNRIFENMSNRAAQLLKEDMEYMGPMRLEEVEESQSRILNIANKLEEAGEIIIPRNGEELV
jgi:flagellar motor switch protein FliG